MNIVKTTLLRIVLLQSICLNMYSMLLDNTVDDRGLQKSIDSKEQQKRSTSSIVSEMVDFDYSQKNIKDLVNEYAAKLGFNILYPEGENITAQVTFNAGKKITVAQAWDFVKMILEQSNYTLVKKIPGVFAIMSKDKVYTEPLPLYIGVNFNQLPDTMERIRYVYYFTNIVITPMSVKSQEIANIINNYIVGGTFNITTLFAGVAGRADITEIEKSLQFNEFSNCMILTTRSDVIKAIMQLITALDQGGFTQEVEIVKLRHASAADVVTLFNDMIGAGSSKKTPNFMQAAAPPAREKYFSESAKVLNLDPNNVRHLNSVVLIGKPVDIEQIKKFITKYIDIPQDSGEAFFHVVNLEWLQATDFATTLNSVTKSPGNGPGSVPQSKSTMISDLGFDPGITILAATTTNKVNSSGGANNATNSSSSATDLQNVVQRGGNQLIVACSPRDWQRIESLIKTMDQPQTQIVIEALVMDLDSSFTKKLGAQLRTQGITTSVFPKHMQAQAGLLVNSILGDATSTTANPDYYSLTGDLSNILNPTLYNASSQPPLVPPNSGAPAANTSAFLNEYTGSTLGLISGGKNRTNGAWAFFQLLSTHNTSKIFTRPVVMTLNNQPVFVTSVVTKNLISGVSGSSTSATQSYQATQAPITMNFKPLISSNNTVNLQIDLELTQFNNADDVNTGDQRTRKISTNVSLKNGDVLVLGGVVKESAQVGKKSVPFFERIPIIGNLFTSRSKISSRSQLFVVIRATIVPPRIQGGMNAITKNVANYMVEQLAQKEEAFGNLKDPITRWFFNSDRLESPSESLHKDINNLSKFDYGVTDEHKDVQQFNGWNEQAVVQPGNSRIGWFCTVPSNNPVASGPATDTDMNHLQKMLENNPNPFQGRLSV